LIGIAYVSVSTIFDYIVDQRVSFIVFCFLFCFVLFCFVFVFVFFWRGGAFYYNSKVKKTLVHVYEKLEDTKVAIARRKSNNRQCNDQKKNDLQNTAQKT
jgi:hypothetical protein